jgi:hypothetical protein
MESGKKHGFPAVDVEEATKEVRRILVRTARAETTISYSELADQVQAIPLDPHSAAMDSILCDLSEEEDTYGRGMISVVVVHKEGDKRPGKGFFELAKQLGYDTSDKELLWVQQLRKVHSYWGRSGRSRR